MPSRCSNSTAPRSAKWRAKRATFCRDSRAGSASGGASVAHVTWQRHVTVAGRGCARRRCSSGSRKCRRRSTQLCSTATDGTTCRRATELPPSTSSAASERCWVMSVHASFTHARLRARAPRPAPGATACASCAAAARAARRTRQPVHRPPRGRRGRRREQLVEVHLVDDLLLEREVGAPLVGERGGGDPPAVVDSADHRVVVHEHVVEEHLVELGLTGDLHERADRRRPVPSCRRRSR